MSPGVQSKIRHIESSVLIRKALTLPVLRIDMLDRVMPTCSERSLNVILRLASITSRLMTIIALYHEFLVFLDIARQFKDV